MKMLYRLGLITVLTVIVLMLDYCTASVLLPDDHHDEIELYALMGFDESECDW